MPDDPGLFSGAPTGFLVFGGIIVAIVVLVFATVIIKGVARWSSNNASPVVTTAARVVARRSDGSGGVGERRAQTSYYATFEVPSGERTELAVPAREFGLIADGDAGQLTYQGTRFKGFDRSSLSSR
ncbi:MAG: DUF2500 domain-containing protein [Terracoccus sp.]